MVRTDGRTVGHRSGEWNRVDRARGIVMLIAAAIAIWKGWQIHRGEKALLVYGLGVLALAMAIWHLTRPADGARRLR